MVNRARKSTLGKNDGSLAWLVNELVRRTRNLVICRGWHGVFRFTSSKFIMGGRYGRVCDASMIFICPSPRYLARR